MPSVACDGSAYQLQITDPRSWDGYLDDDEASAAVVRCLEVDITLVMADVKALDSVALFDPRRGRKGEGYRRA